MQWPIKDEDSDSIAPGQPPKEDRPADTVIVDDFVGSYSKYIGCNFSNNSLKFLQWGTASVNVFLSGSDSANIV